MSETWTSLLAALVGAIVGGAASLAGTMLVNKQQMATNARMRLYDEVLPALSRAMDSAYMPQVPEDQVAGEHVPEMLTKVRRVSAIAGRHERKFAEDLGHLWAFQEYELIELPESLNAQDREIQMRREVQRRLNDLQGILNMFSEYLELKLG